MLQSTPIDRTFVAVTHESIHFISLGSEWCAGWVHNQSYSKQDMWTFLVTQSEKKPHSLTSFYSERAPLDTKNLELVLRNIKKAKVAEYKAGGGAADEDRRRARR